jgi:hypothetical protein
MATIPVSISDNFKQNHLFRIERATDFNSCDFPDLISQNVADGQTPADLASNLNFYDLPQFGSQDSIDGQSLDFSELGTDSNFCSLPELGSQDTIDGQNLDFSKIAPILAKQITDEKSLLTWLLLIASRHHLHLRRRVPSTDCMMRNLAKVALHEITLRTHS